MLKYKPEELQKSLSDITSDKVVPVLKDNMVNPDTIREIAVIDSLAILKISRKYYALTALSSGYRGAGPGALKELMEWCGCTNDKIYDEIDRQPRVHFARRESEYWEICIPNEPSEY